MSTLSWFPRFHIQELFSTCIKTEDSICLIISFVFSLHLLALDSYFITLNVALYQLDIWEKSDYPSSVLRAHDSKLIAARGDTLRSWVWHCRVQAVPSQELGVSFYYLFSLLKYIMTSSFGFTYDMKHPLGWSYYHIA